MIKQKEYDSVDIGPWFSLGILLAALCDLFV
jgi:hypothetical protein